MRRERDTQEAAQNCVFIEPSNAVLISQHIMPFIQGKTSLHVWSTFLHFCCLVPKLSLTFFDPMGCSPPSKNTGMGCHFLLQMIFPKWSEVKWKSFSRVQLFVIAWCNSPGQNTGVGSLSLLQGIFPTQGTNLHRLHWQVDSLPLSHLGSTFLH